ncbi:hypothetical protein NDU88_006425 [Pleurodeles waltl]|uniref:Uncharacterized protein n=1 Tax=Pleurodeles waltl TaxID=8319 RepID=A0AAV7WCH8_PLEWA|nr:hypothetical protein NDU88_006425 [Pleurodeles waltl]
MGDATRGVYGAVNGAAAYSPVPSHGLPWRLRMAEEAGRSREEKATKHGSGGSHPPTQPHTMVDRTLEGTMDGILQEILAVGRRLEGMDNAITSLTAETKSMRLDIADFQSRVTGLVQRVTTVEGNITTFQDRDQELFYLRSKLIDLEDRSRRDNVSFFRFQ